MQFTTVVLSFLATLAVAAPAAAPVADDAAMAQRARELLASIPLARLKARDAEPEASLNKRWGGCGECSNGEKACWECDFRGLCMNFLNKC
jgi:Tfp pilus assembly protein FimT